MYFFYNSIKLQTENPEEKIKKMKQIDDEDVKSFALELDETITKEYKRGVYSRRENKDSLLKLKVLKKHIAKLFDDDNNKGLQYIFMLDANYSDTIPSWVLWDLYDKELLAVVKGDK